MESSIAILDACVLYPAPLRDALMHLALVDSFTARWTETIHDEWIRSVLADRSDLTIEQLDRTRKLMNAHVRDCLVDNYEGLIEDIDLPDKNDRHVLAAAIKAEADVIVTFNLKDFPSKALQRYKVKAIHPDKFVKSLIRSDPESAKMAFTRQRANLKNPPLSIDEFLRSLYRNGLTESVDELRTLIDS